MDGQWSALISQSQPQQQRLMRSRIGPNRAEDENDGVGVVSQPGGTEDLFDVSIGYFNDLSFSCIF